MLFSTYLIYINSASAAYHRQMHFLILVLLLFVYEIAAYKCKYISVNKLSIRNIRKSVFHL